MYTKPHLEYVATPNLTKILTSVGKLFIVEDNVRFRVFLTKLPGLRCQCVAWYPRISWIRMGFCLTDEACATCVPCCSPWYTVRSVVVLIILLIPPGGEWNNMRYTGKWACFLNAFVFSPPGERCPHNLHPVHLLCITLHCRKCRS